MNILDPAAYCASKYLYRTSYAILLADVTRMQRQRQRNQNTADGEFSRDEAQEIWSEASKLQAEAARHLQERSSGIADLQAEEKEASGILHVGLSPDEIRQIGEEAGIAAEFVDLAIAKQKATAAAETFSPGPTGDWAGKLLGYPARSLDVSRTMGSSASETLEAMKRIFPSKRYGLELVDVYGDGTSEDSLLVFKVPRAYSTSMAGSSYNSFAMSMAYSDVNRLYVSIHALSENSCQVTTRMDLDRSKRRNAWASILMSGVLAVAFAAMVGAFDSASMIPVILALLPLFFFGGLQLYKPLYRWSVGKGVRAVENLLQVVDTDAKTGGGFSSVGSQEKPGSSLW